MSSNRILQFALMQFFNQTLDKIETAMISEKALKCQDTTTPKPVPAIYNCKPSKKTCPSLNAYVSAMKQPLRTSFSKDKSDSLAKLTVSAFTSKPVQQQLKAWCEDFSSELLPTDRKINSFVDTEQTNDALESIDEVEYYVFVKCIDLNNT